MLVQQKQNIKGLSLLEILVVLAIIGVIAGVGFPNFTKWQQDRKVRAQTERIATVFTSATSQVERGVYPYVRVEITTENSKIKILAKGIKQEKFSSDLNDGHVPDCKVSPFFTSAEEIISYELDDIKLFYLAENAGAAVCFSKGGKYFKLWNRASTQGLATLEKNTRHFVAVCHHREKSCDAEKESFNKDDKKPVYLVNYSRFGLVQKYKWNYAKKKWQSR
jgi:prepilin-type N-terminal cleavage/methylation domain-containing protein